jgi:hypothetical protein
MTPRARNLTNPGQAGHTATTRMRGPGAHRSRDLLLATGMFAAEAAMSMTRGFAGTFPASRAEQVFGRSGSEYRGVRKEGRAGWRARVPLGGRASVSGGWRRPRCGTRCGIGVLTSVVR